MGVDGTVLAHLLGLGACISLVISWFRASCNVYHVADVGLFYFVDRCWVRSQLP